MPEHSFPEATPPDGSHSVAKSFLNVETQARFTSTTIDSIQGAWNESWPKLLNDSQSGVDSLLRPLTFHAEPLAPLRQRDELALEEFFGDSYQIDEIVNDIYGRLGQLCPEPCWEDDPFDFLRGYL